jgi:predicted nucleic acid-binding protein
MPGPATFLLDTNVIVALVRAGPLGQHIESQYHVTTQAFRPLISVVSVGEILKLTKGFNWNCEKVQRLQTLLGNLVQVDLNHPGILQAYAEIAWHCEHVLKPARTKPQNDYWIAATAKATEATLLTTDEHFDDLHGHFIQRALIDENVARKKP